MAQSGVQFDPELVAILKAHRKELALLVDGALHVWVPKLYRNRRRRSLASRESVMEVVS